MSEHIELVFGDGTDNDTWDNVFRHLAEGGYIIAVNDIDIQVEDTYGPDGSSGLFGLIFNDELGQAEPGNERFFAWDDIRRVVIY